MGNGIIFIDWPDHLIGCNKSRYLSPVLANCRRVRGHSLSPIRKAKCAKLIENTWLLGVLNYETLVATPQVLQQTFHLLRSHYWWSMKRNYIGHVLPSGFLPFRIFLPFVFIFLIIKVDKLRSPQQKRKGKWSWIAASLCFPAQTATISLNKDYPTLLYTKARFSVIIQRLHNGLLRNLRLRKIPVKGWSSICGKR